MRRVPAELWVAFALAVCSLFAYSDFITDDALISLRYARHLARGEGLRWNPGGPTVEGYSNFTHVGLGALATLVGLPPLDVLRAVNWAAVLALVALVYALTRRLGCGRIAAGGAAAIVAVHPPLAYWADSGLETALYGALLLCGVWRLEPRPGSGRAASALPWIAMAMTRPEGAVIVVLVPAVLYLQRWLAQEGDAGPMRALCREHGRWLAWFSVVYAAYFAWRWHYFGHPWPNSVYYKAEAEQGGILLRQFLLQTLPVVVLALLVPLRRLTASGAVLLSVPLAYAVMLYDAAESVAQLHRFFVPSFACLIVLAAVTVEHRILPHTRWGAVLAWLAVAAWTLGHERSGVGAVRAGIVASSERMRARVAVAEWVHRERGPEAEVAIGDVGVVGYLLDNPIHDLFGLNAPSFVHEFDRERRPYVREIMRARPDVVVVLSRDPDTFVGRWATDRYVLASAGFAKAYRLAHRITSTNDRYHYRIYVREAGEPSPGEEHRDGGSPAALVRRARASIEAG